MRQQYRSAMVPPQHEPTSCQIDVVSSRQVSMLHTSLLTVLNYCHMLGFACSHITLDTILPMKPLLLLTSLRLCFNTSIHGLWGGALGVKKKTEHVTKITFQPDSTLFYDEISNKIVFNFTMKCQQ